MYKVEDAEPKQGSPIKRYRVSATCDKCGTLFLDHRTTKLPDTTQKTYCMKCSQEIEK